jgi:hypothetical protein
LPFAQNLAKLKELHDLKTANIHSKRYLTQFS